MGRPTDGFRIVRVGDGAYRVRFTHAGQRIDRSTGSRDPDEAQRIGAAVYAAVTGGAGTHATIAGQPLEVLLEAWLDTVTENVCRATAKTYTAYAERYLAPFFGTLTGVTSVRAAEYTRARLAKVKRRTVLKELSALRGFLAWCVEVGHLEEAPRISAPSPRATGHSVWDRRVVPLEPQEVDAILARLPERGRGGSMPRAFYTVMWETGLRTGTLARISVPEHYEPGRSALSVNDAIDKVRFGRELPLTSRARDVLDAVSPRCGLVFGDRNLVGQLRRAARAAGLSDERARRVSNHHIRHARATHLASRSDNLVGVAFLLGHKHLTTTAIYARPRERAAREVIAAIDGSGVVMRGASPEAPGSSSEAAVPHPCSCERDPRIPAW